MSLSAGHHESSSSPVGRQDARSDSRHREQCEAVIAAPARVTVRTAAARVREADVVPADHLTAGSDTVSLRHTAFGEQNGCVSEPAEGSEAELLWAALGQNVPAAPVEGRLRTVVTVEVLTQDSRRTETQNQEHKTWEPAETSFIEHHKVHFVPENPHHWTVANSFSRRSSSMILMPHFIKAGVSCCLNDLN